MTDDSLLRAIIADPADDLPRLIYADWLQDHGEERRANFIRQQIAGVKVPVLDQLVECHHLWVSISDLPNCTISFCWERGFVHMCYCSWADWLAHNEAIRAACPVTEVRLTTWPAESPEAAALERFYCQQTGIRARLDPRWPNVTMILPERSPVLGRIRADYERRYTGPQSGFAHASTVS